MIDYFDDDAYSKAVEILKKAERIGATGCGHSGIICQHFAQRKIHQLVNNDEKIIYAM